MERRQARTAKYEDLVISTFLSGPENEHHADFPVVQECEQGSPLDRYSGRRHAR